MKLGLGIGSLAAVVLSESKLFHYIIYMIGKVLHRCILISLFLLSSICSFAQIGKVLVQNDAVQGTAYAVNVKWYSQELLYPSGVNLYRREKGQRSWSKLNTNPILKKNGLPPALYKQDDNLEMFVALINGATASDLQGFVLLNVMIKSFESEPYADFLGITYQDQQLTEGKAYQYKVAKIAGKGEVLIGISDFITAGQFVPDVPVQEVKVNLVKRAAQISWKPEDGRFYGVNIYRKNASQAEPEKLNQRPVMITLSPDENGDTKLPEVLYVDDSLQENTLYTYYLAGTDFFGKETAPTVPISISVSDVTPSPAPINLKETIDNPQVILEWENIPSADLAGTYVYRSTKSDGPFARITHERLPVNLARYSDVTTKSGPYYYYVSSVDTAGNEAPSRTVFAEVHDITPPAKPTGVRMEADTGKIVLRWQMNKEADLMGYLLYRTIDKASKDKFVLLNADPVFADQFVDKIPFNAKNKFLYRIVAIDSSYNKSDPSEVVAARMPDILPPAKPFIKGVREEGETLVIEWVPNIDEDLLGYHIYRATGSDTASFKQLNVNLLARGSFRFTDRFTDTGGVYFYSLQAIDSSGNVSAQSNNYVGKRSTPAGKEIAFSSTKASFNKRKKEVTISWKVAENTSLLGYVIYRKEGEAGAFTQLTGMMNARDHADGNVEKGKAYYYEIRAYLSSGHISKSDIVAVDIQE